MNDADAIIRRIQFCIAGIWIVLIFFTITLAFLSNPEFFFAKSDRLEPVELPTTTPDNYYWTPPDSTAIPNNPDGNQIRYGYDLVAHTAIYLGPNGKVLQITNGMNCQNCHLKAGRKIFGNNFSAVASTYPKYRGRSGTNESIEKRVNDCIERSLNGRPLNEDSNEMRAFVAYISWVGSNVPKGNTPDGAGLITTKFLDRAADPNKGLAVYEKLCARCHGLNGQGLKADNGMEWKYPPLYGNDSYNIGAGLYRLSRFAGYVKANMPTDLATYEKPVLTDEQAWDVAAYVNSMPRPQKDISMDWPNILEKPFDHPYGPFPDGFAEAQHKYGPFKEMVEKKR